MQDPVYFASKCYLITQTGLKPITIKKKSEQIWLRKIANKI